MGIKFLCPNGHKLHVKSFLSGKKAVCPKCGIHVTVPAASQDLTALSSASVLGGEVPGGDSVSAIVEAGNSHAGAPITLVAPNQATRTIVAPAIESPRTPTDPATPRPAHKPSEPGKVSAQSAGASSQSAATGQSDAIDAAPSALWYVRPATGGQFGPATGEVMRTWIQQLRVGATSLVWRTGWTSWQPAATVFPQLANVANPMQTAPAHGNPPLPVSGNGAISQPTVTPVVAASIPAAAELPTASILPAVRNAEKLRQDNRRNLIASAVLGGVALVLIVVLLFVLRKPSSPPAPGTEVPATSGTAAATGAAPASAAAAPTP